MIRISRYLWSSNVIKSQTTYLSITAPTESDLQFQTVLWIYSNPHWRCAQWQEDYTENRQLIFHLTFHSYKYTHSHLDENKFMFSCYKWSNITIFEMYCFLEIILKMPLILSDENGYWTLLYPPTYAFLSPTFQFKIKVYLLWTKECMSYSSFFKSGQRSIQKVELVKKEINVIIEKRKWHKELSFQE